MTAKRNTTLVRFYVKTAAYISGEGASEKYELFEYPINSAGQMNSLVWVNWQSLFGSELREMELKGIRQPAKIQCPYIPGLYNALLKKEQRLSDRNKRRELSAEEHLHNRGSARTVPVCSPCNNHSWKHSNSGSQISLPGMGCNEQ